jgi:predicted RNA methylase
MINELKLTEEEISNLNKTAEQFKCSPEIMYIIRLLEKANHIVGVTIDFGIGTGALGCKCAIANAIAYYVLDYKKENEDERN